MPVQNNDELAYFQYTGPDPNVKGLDWETWAFIMVTNDRFNLLEYEIEKQTLILKNNREPSQALIKRFDRVQNVIIEADNSEMFFERSRKYLGLTSIKKLVIRDLTTEIDFISSRNVEYMSIWAEPLERQLNRQITDHAKPLLAISTKLRLFRYQNGMIGDESLTYMRNNPIEFLDLQHVTIFNENLFTNFLRNTPTLKKLALQGPVTANAQISFLSNGNTAMNQITHLWITLQIRLRNLYQEIRRCVNLELIVLTFEKPDLLRTILPHLLELRNLKRVVINYYPLRDNQNYINELMATAYYKDLFKNEFDARNIILQYYHEFMTNRNEPPN